MINCRESAVCLTIFTPAYNRADFLPKLFSSIHSQLQPNDKVEWLVIDDGSEDQTQTVVAEIIKKHSGLVRYQRVENGGKHRAMNLAAQLARGDWFLTVDSDDFLIDNAISQIMTTIEQTKDDERIAILRGLKYFPQRLKQYHFQVETNPCSHKNWILLQRYGFDSAEVIRTAVLQKHPFPEISGERFMAESWLWHQLGREYLTYFINNFWIECYYQEEGLSAGSRQIRANSPRNAMAVYQSMLASNLPWLSLIRTSINWWRYRFHALSQQKNMLSTFKAAWIYAIPGWLMFMMDQRVLK